MLRSVLLGVVLAGILAGCSWDGDTVSSHHTGSTTYPLPKTGTVAGRVVVKGGVQFPHRKKPPPATDTRFTFVAIPASGPMIVRHLKTDREGRFRLDLPPGRYRFGRTFVASEPLAQAARQSNVVRVGRVVRVRLIEGVR
jgi:hypothetical protein